MKNELNKSNDRDVWKIVFGVSIVINVLLLIFIGLPGVLFWIVTFVALAKLFPNAGRPEVVGTYDPNAAEIKARTKRNIAIALALLAFTAFVFITMVSRGVLPS